MSIQNNDLTLQRFNASTDRLTVLGFSIVVVMAGLLYFFTAARDIVFGDTPELIIAAALLGVAHPPGYPLLTMLGHLFSLLPLGPIPFRVNLLASVCDALTVGVVFLTALRLSRSRLAAAMAALVLALNSLFWSWSLVAEVFPLNNLLASLMIYLLVVWHEQPERSGALITTFFLGGLALTNHQTIVLLGPAFCFLLWQRRSVLWKKPQIFALCIVVFLLGLVPYAYVPWAAAHQPLYSWGSVSSLKDLLALITRQSYGGRHLVDATYRGGSSLHRILMLCLSFGAPSFFDGDVMAVEEAPNRADPETRTPPGQARLQFGERDVLATLHRLEDEGTMGLDPLRTAVSALGLGLSRAGLAKGPRPADCAGYAHPKPRRRCPA